LFPKLNSNLRRFEKVRISFCSVDKSDVSKVFGKKDMYSSMDAITGLENHPIDSRASKLDIQSAPHISMARKDVLYSLRLKLIC